MKRDLLKWELAGIPVIAVLGTLLHFVFEWSGGCTAAAVVGAVNESVWEHLKMTFWPALFYAGVEYFYLGKETRSFLAAKTVGIYTMPVIIIVLYYGYTYLINRHILAVDIFIFIMAVMGGQLSSYFIMKGYTFTREGSRIALLSLSILALAFIIFTFFPPHFPLFKDPSRGIYGIPGNR